MTNFLSESRRPLAPRFRVLVNGFADGEPFPTLQQAVNSVPGKGVEGMSFEIYDRVERRFVWTKPRRRDSRSNPGAFSIRVDGHPLGLSFVSLAEAADYISVRPPGRECAVFRDETCVFMAPSSLRLNLVEAL
jgi:hypothetical protein